ncbi:hypothetical protein TA3x_003133 [Tundrisphaera sp. TA3]|uniref:hypothetical protein n=1 Tax=Tundrisphaera sp. TA3 TaxID=3435775 RepID=UPI003EB6E12E
MPIGPVLSRLRRIRLLRSSKTRPRRRAISPSAERLDLRQLLSTISLVSASTADSKGVTITYDAAPSDGPTPLIGVFRSADPAFDAGDRQVGPSVALPAFDDAGRPSTEPGRHRMTIPVAGGLAIAPERPFVLVVADPGSSTAGQAGEVASFRKASMAVVTHGGLQSTKDKKHGPPWARQMARKLREEGYDRVLVFNWVAQSSTPGAAAKQAPRLARAIRRSADRFPDGEPVDLHLIGHSEGAVVNTQAIVRVIRSRRPEIEAGYLQDTLLDPHAANPRFPGRQYSTAGPVGWMAKLAIDNYQSRARDPLVFIPKGVDSAQVFYQQTPADQDRGTNAGVYNLWGQVPVPGTADYFNLTPAGVVHSGKFGVARWYGRHIVPSLGDGAPGLDQKTLKAEPDGPVLSGSKATYAGTAEPGATIRLTAARGQDRLVLVAKSVVGRDGSWTATTRPLAPGVYRVIAATQPAGWTREGGQAIPTAPLGPLVIGPGKARAASKDRS